MSVYVGLDLHRKRLQISVLEPDGTERLNRNVRKDAPELCELLGNLPAGTPGGVRGSARLVVAAGAARGLRAGSASDAPVPVQAIASRG